jgi:outer membrane protein assembly factor BamA
MMASTLLPVLFAAGLGLSAHEGETVASVRVEGVPDAARYAARLEIKPGEPLQRSALHHVVEVLYASGDFADVVVEGEATPGGLALLFRLVPAPRLGDVRVRGDLVVSPGDVKRIARLRSREPLWPQRLDAAGRDVALHLTRQGFLEAQVTAAPAPAGERTDAVVTIHAGPRARVGDVQLEGLDAASTVAARQLLPRRDAVYRREVAESCVERIRKQLIAGGHWRAQVRQQEVYDPATARVALRFVADPGPPTEVEFRGAGVSGTLRGQLRNLLRDGGLKGDVIEEATDRLEEELRASGHRDVAVSHHEEQLRSRQLLIYEIQPGPQAIAAAVSVHGAPGLEGLLRTRPGLPVQDRVLEEDARILARSLEEDGYANPQVEIEAPEGGGLLSVSYRVRPGPRTLVATAAVAAPEPLAADATPPRELRQRAGRPYRAREVALDRNDLVAAYRNAGFLQAEVVPQVTFAEDRSTAAITLKVTPGPRTLVDHIVVSGLDHTREEVVRRELLVKEGEPLGLQKVLESQRRLGAIGIFQRVSVSEMDPESLERRSLVVSAEEARRTTIAYGVGYAERDKLRGSLEVTQRNISGMDRSLTTFVRVGKAANRVLTTFREPYLFGHRQELFITGFREEEDRESFDFLRFGGLVQAARPFSPRWSVIARYSFQQTEVFNILVPLDEVDRQFRSSTTSGPSASVVNDTRDDPLDPHRGRFLGADVQLSLHALGGTSFVKSFLQASTYRRLTPRTTLALAGRLGLARTLGFGVPLRLPLPDRFFAGGDYSLRGFKLDTAGPLERGIPAEPGQQGPLLPTGGNALLLGSVELRLDLGRYVQLATFTDAGNVYPLVSDLAFGDVRYTAGLGVRYRSALGPLRIDWGYKLNRRKDEEASHLHFTIGHAF